jgi:hypothetical protein
MNTSHESLQYESPPDTARFESSHILFALRFTGFLIRIAIVAASISLYQFSGPSGWKAKQAYSVQRAFAACVT